MKQIYVVTGETGMYSDRRNWIVVAYESREKAEHHVVQAKAQSEIDKARYRAYWNEGFGIEQHPQDYEGDGGFLMKSQWDADDETSDDWSVRNRYHEIIMYNSSDDIRYEVVPLELRA